MKEVGSLPWHSLSGGRRKEVCACGGGGVALCAPFSRPAALQGSRDGDPDGPMGAVGRGGRGAGVGTRPWWLALLAYGCAYWPLALEPSAMTSRRPYYCVHPHCRGHPPAWGGGGHPECNFCPWRPHLTA